MRKDPATVRDVKWLFVHIGTGVPFGLVAFLCAAGIVATVVLTPCGGSSQLICRCSPFSFR